MQRAINSLAQSGAQLEAGDVKAAAGTLRYLLLFGGGLDGRGRLAVGTIAGGG